MERHNTSSSSAWGRWALAAVLLLGLPGPGQAQTEPPEPQEQPKSHAKPVDRTPPREQAAPRVTPSAAPDRPAPSGQTAVRRGERPGSDRPAASPAGVQDRVPDRSNSRERATASSGSSRQRFPSGEYSGVAVSRSHRPPASGPGGGGWDPDYYRPAYWNWAPWGWGLGSWFYYDPFWWGTAATYSGQGGAPYQYPPTGSVRLKVKPRDAHVFVDGYYVGIVDAFDGNFQSLALPAGPHHLEVRREGLQSLEFNVYVLADRTLKLSGTLQP